MSDIVTSASGLVAREADTAYLSLSEKGAYSRLVAY